MPSTIAQAAPEGRGSPIQRIADGDGSVKSIRGAARHDGFPTKIHRQSVRPFRPHSYFGGNAPSGSLRTCRIALRVGTEALEIAEFMARLPPNEREATRALRFLSADGPIEGRFGDVDATSRLLRLVARLPQGQVRIAEALLEPLRGSTAVCTDTPVQRGGNGIATSLGGTRRRLCSTRSRSSPLPRARSRDRALDAAGAGSGTSSMTGADTAQPDRRARWWR
jgi:hypothetical protein